MQTARWTLVYRISKNVLKSMKATERVRYELGLEQSSIAEHEATK
jgi:hypothetical protein